MLDASINLIQATDSYEHLRYTELREQFKTPLSLLEGDVSSPSERVITNENITNAKLQIPQTKNVSFDFLNKIHKRSTKKNILNNLSKNY